MWPALGSSEGEEQHGEGYLFEVAFASGSDAVDVVVGQVHEFMVPVDPPAILPTLSSWASERSEQVETPESWTGAHRPRCAFLVRAIQGRHLVINSESPPKQVVTL